MKAASFPFVRLLMIATVLGTRAGAAQSEETPARPPAEEAVPAAPQQNPGDSGTASPEMSGDQENASTAEARSFSEAETILWTTDQLKGIDKPARLNYEFKKTSSIEEGFSDTVAVDIVAVKADGMKSAKVNWFTGERNQYVDPYESTNGNPVLAIYLYGDVVEMQRLTEGGWHYFHRRVKHALAESAEVSPVTIEYNGKTVQARQVRFTPYAKDPKREKNEKYARYADKVYLITVSDEVPGYVYQIHTTVPPGKDAPSQNVPLIEETLTLVSLENLEASTAQKEK